MCVRESSAQATSSPIEADLGHHHAPFATEHHHTENRNGGKWSSATATAIVVFIGWI
jgi:hypothetical protein